MLEHEECAAKYRQLLQLLEEDGEEIAGCLRGEMLDAYRAILTQEKDVLRNALHLIQTNY